MTTKLELAKLCLQLRDAQKAYDRAFSQYQNTITGFGIVEPIFWDVMELLQKQIKRFQYDYKRSTGVKDGCAEIMRQSVVGDLEIVKGKTTTRLDINDMFKFVHTYRTASDCLSKALTDVADRGGSDSYGDLIDALPLVGYNFYRNAMDGHYKSNAEMEQAVKEATNSFDFSKLILKGENYVHSCLEDALKIYFKNEAGEMIDNPQEANNE